MTTGKLIFIEGVNGAGKSTQIQLLQEAYRNVIFTIDTDRPVDIVQRDVLALVEKIISEV